MITVIYKKADLRYIFLTGDPYEMTELEKYLNLIPNYMFLPSFAGYQKSPEVFLNKFRSRSGEIVYYCHSGLWKTIYDWAKENNIEITGIDSYFKYTDFNMSLDDFKEYVGTWRLSLEPYDYQYHAAWLILKYRQSLSQLATRAGKTLIAYMVFRYMLEHGAHNILMIVPGIHLLKQGIKDMEEYKEFFTSETVWANGEMCSMSNLTIGTYQSLNNMLNKGSKHYNPSFFNKFDVVCVDEAHHLVCKSINTIISQKFMTFVKLRFGFTGTLPKENTIESYCCHSLMGPTIQIIKPMELVEGGFLATPNMIQVRINYPWTDELTDYCIRCGEYLNSNYVMDGDKKISLPKDQKIFTMIHQKTLPKALIEIRKSIPKEEYRDYLIDLCKAKGANLLNLEQMMLHNSKIRMDAICHILDKLNKNVIVFAHHTEYLKYLRDEFIKRYPDKIVLYIAGQISVKKREKILNTMIDNNNVILCASYGCCSTGLTFKNVDYGIFAQSFKSNIINLQSIGRLMLKNDKKDKFYLYDIIDHFPTNRLYAQGIEKINIYKRENFPYRIYEYDGLVLRKKTSR